MVQFFFVYDQEAVMRLVELTDISIRPRLQFLSPVTGYDDEKKSQKSQKSHPRS